MYSKEELERLREKQYEPDPYFADLGKTIKTGKEKVKEGFSTFEKVFLSGIQGLVKSIASGDIKNALENTFDMIGNAVAEHISIRISAQIPGLGGGILGAIGGGLVGGLFGMLFDKGKERGAEPSRPLYVYDTHWDEYFKYGMTLPMSFVYSGRGGSYNVDPHGRTMDGWSTGQHFDA